MCADMRNVTSLCMDTVCKVNLIKTKKYFRIVSLNRTVALETLSGWQ